MRTIFHNKNTTNTGGSNRTEEYEILVDPAITRSINLLLYNHNLIGQYISCQIPPEAPFVPKSSSAIKEIENFHESRGWLVGEKGPHPSSLPSLYCQVMLKEYHVTDAVSLVIIIIIIVIAVIIIIIVIIIIVIVIIDRYLACVWVECIIQHNLSYQKELQYFH